MDVLPTPEAEEAEGLKILNIRCNCRRIFVFLKSPLFEKVFADNFIYCSYETYMKMLEKSFLGVHTAQTAPKHVWMRHCGRIF